MSRRKRAQRRVHRSNRRRRRPETPWLDRILGEALHPQTPEGRPWKLLPLVLAFPARAAVALSGDFVLHPDEIM